MIHRVQVVPSVPGMKMCTPSGSLKSEKVELVFTLFHNILSGGVPVATMLACYPYMLFKLQRMQRDAGKACNIVMITIIKHDLAVSRSANLLHDDKCGKCCR